MREVWTEDLFEGRLLHESGSQASDKAKDSRPGILTGECENNIGRDLLNHEDSTDCGG